MRWYYLSHFSRYRLALEKTPLYTVDKHDALGDQANQRGASFGNEACMALTNRVFQALQPEMRSLPTTLFHLGDALTFSNTPLLLPFLLM